MWLSCMLMTFSIVIWLPVDVLFQAVDRMLGIIVVWSLRRCIVYLMLAKLVVEEDADGVKYRAAY